MIATEERYASIEGYETPIKQALWMRVCTGGVPRAWAAMWMCACLYMGLITMVAFGFMWLLVPGVLWLVGHGTLVALTLFDVHWDEMAMAQLTRNYRGYYTAG